jgi:catechol 2,3-dioxygenase-like lactoylglutathione lyase family enzyme
MKFVGPLLLVGAMAGCGRGCQDAGSTAGAPAGSAPPGTDTHSGSLLGGERGLDHVGVAVKDLDAATHIYHDLLGFSRPIEGRLPNGLRNVNYYFSDATYLETLVYWDRDKARWLADFTDAHSGALFAVLSAYSPEASTAYLSKRGIQVGAPISGTIQTAGEDAAAEEKWKTFFLPRGFLPGDPLYFISYKRDARDEFLHQLDDPRQRRKLLHKNTALGVRAVWLAVPDLEVASRAYEAIGLPRKRDFADPALGAAGRAFGAGEGELWLLAPSAPDGKTALFLRERSGPGIMGVTLAAGSLPVAAKVIGEGTGAPMPTYPGQLGTSFRLEPDLTLGVWLEFSQQS